MYMLVSFPGRLGTRLCTCSHSKPCFVPGLMVSLVGLLMPGLMVSLVGLLMPGLMVSLVGLLMPGLMVSLVGLLMPGLMVSLVGLLMPGLMVSLVGLLMVSLVGLLMPALIKSNTACASIPPSRRRTSLVDLLPGASDEGLDLLGRLLQFNPDKRITSHHGILHPYVAR